MVALGLVSNHYWVLIKDKKSIPPNAYHVGVHAKQFEWQVTYPGPDGKLGTSDDFTVRNQLHVTVNEPIAVELSSEDVIHSFFVPEFRLKQDAVPGMHITAWFQATKTGPGLPNKSPEAPNDDGRPRTDSSASRAHELLAQVHLLDRP